MELGTCLLWEDIDFDICEEYNSYIGETHGHKEPINVDNFKKLQVYHDEKLKEIDVRKYEEERLQNVLDKAKIQYKLSDAKSKYYTSNYRGALNIYREIKRRRRKKKKKILYMRLNN